MTSRQITSIRRIAATAALSLAGLGLGAGVAAADQLQNDDLDIIDGPVCTPYDLNSFGVLMEENGQGDYQVSLTYSDGILTCDTPMSVRRYVLPHAQATIDHPETTLAAAFNTMLSAVEISTEVHGQPLPALVIPGNSCSATRVAVNNQTFSTSTYVQGCGQNEPEHPGDLVNPDPVDPEPELPGDFVNPDPVDLEPELPGDGGNGDGGNDDGDDAGVDPVDPELPGDDGVEPVEPQQVPQADEPGEFVTTGGAAPEAGPGAGTNQSGAGQTGSDEVVTMLPTTGASTTVMAALAAMLVALGGAGMHIARREVI